MDCVIRILFVKRRVQLINWSKRKIQIQTTMNNMKPFCQNLPLCSGNTQSAHSVCQSSRFLKAGVVAYLWISMGKSEPTSLVWTIKLYSCPETIESNHQRWSRDDHSRCGFIQINPIHRQHPAARDTHNLCIHLQLKIVPNKHTLWVMFSGNHSDQSNYMSPFFLKTYL